MMKHRILSGVAAVALMMSVGLTHSQALAQEFDKGRLAEGIRTISADDFQGRYPGTVGETKTLEWLKAQYEALGLEPGGRQGQWLQMIELKRYTPVEGAASLTLTLADGTVKSLEIGKDAIVRSIANDGQAAITDAELVFAGYGITAPERNWDDYGDLDVTGKVVLVMQGEPDGELFNGEYTTNYQSGAYKADEALRRGAVGVITLMTVGSDAPRWTMSARRGMGQRTLSPGAADLEFTASVPSDVAASLVPNFADIKPSISDGQFKAYDLAGAKVSVTASETMDVLTTNNLLAKIPGTTHPDETIIFSAHWDHVGSNHNAEGEDKIFNGAWDNASGTVGVVEMARALKAAPAPERTLVFLHVTAEELGLLGSFGYVADPVYSLATTVANINIDMLPLSASTKDVAIFGLGQNSLEDDLAVFAAEKGRYVGDDGQPSQGFYYRSDHFAFARAGVPALMPWHGWDLVEGGKEAGEAQWRARFSADYHKVSDEWSDDIDLTSAVENLGLLYQLATKLANSRDWPTWKPRSEFGQVRERSASARQD